MAQIAQAAGAEILAASEAGLSRRTAQLASRRAALAGTVYLLLDHSASMADGKLAQLKRGALGFFGAAYARGYATGLIAFSNRARCLLGATRNHERFQKALARLEPEGRTAMASAIHLAQGRLRSRAGARVMVLITDGVPDDRAAALRAAALTRAAGIELVAIGTDGADLAFLAMLTARPELAGTHAEAELAEALERRGHALPR